MRVAVRTPPAEALRIGIVLLKEADGGRGRFEAGRARLSPEPLLEAPILQMGPLRLREMN